MRAFLYLNGYLTDRCVGDGKGNFLGKKLLVSFLVVLGLFMGTVASAKTYRVGVSIYQFTDNFMTLYRNEIERLFRSLETEEVRYELTVVDGKNDMAEQASQIQSFIIQGMDVIILNLVQTSSADAIIEQVSAAGIPLVLINREPLAYDREGNILPEAYEGILNHPQVCYVGADGRQAGLFQGEMVAELPDRGDINGDGVVSYVMIEGDPENIDAQYCTEYSIKALRDAGARVECLDDQVGNWEQTKGQELCANALNIYGDRVEVVLCNNDAMALGAATAIETAGRQVGKDIYLFGVDALEEAVELIREGGMTGTVLSNYGEQARAAVDVAVRLLRGEKVPDYTWIDYVKFDKAYAESH